MWGFKFKSVPFGMQRSCGEFNWQTKWFWNLSSSMTQTKGSVGRRFCKRSIERRLEGWILGSVPSRREFRCARKLSLGKSWSFLFVCLFVRLFVCLFVCLSVCLFVCFEVTHSRNILLAVNFQTSRQVIWTIPRPRPRQSTAKDGFTQETLDITMRTRCSTLWTDWKNSLSTKGTR